MKFQFRMPELTAYTSEGMVRQLHGYLRQLVNELGVTLNSSSAADSRQFNLTPCPGVAVKKQLCKARGTLVAGAAAIRIQGLPGKTWTPVAQVPREMAPGVTTAISVAMPGGEAISGYIQGRDSQTPGMVMVCPREAMGKESECYLSFVYQEG